VRVRDLIRSAAIRSANDAAVVLAEAIGGTEARFAQLMTQKARSLGMRNTTFRNASGLTADGHLSTPRDMAILSRHLMFDFPQYFNIFGRRTTTAFGRSIRNTNRLLGSYMGADGIKTGYTRAAGWNLSASAKRGSEHVIAVMFGGSSSRSRNSEVARLLDIGFSRAQTVVAVVEPGRLPSPRPVPNPRRKPVLVATAEPAPVVVAAAAPVVIGAVEPDFPIPRPAPNRPPMDEPGWTVELGAFSAREEAVATLASVAFGDVPGLADASREVTPLDTDGDDALYAARFTGVDGLTALTACAVIAAEGQRCEPQPPGQGGY
jgi:D-alanyl-D-alanine carboxypeptidase